MNIAAGLRPGPLAAFCLLALACLSCTPGHFRTEVAQRFTAEARPSSQPSRAVPTSETAGVKTTSEATPAVGDPCRVKTITRIGIGSQPDLSPDGGLVAYVDRVQGTYEVFLMNADGSNVRCLTCASVPKELVGKHKGQHAFYPLGNYLMFGAENEYGNHGLTSIPGIGDNWDLWMTDLQTGTYWRLTHTPKNSAIQYPRFSSDGQKLLWGQRYAKPLGSFFRRSQEFGLWNIILADVQVSQTSASLANEVELQPGGPGFYEPHGFSPDGSKIIFTGEFQPGRSAWLGEIWTYDLTNKKLTKLAGGDDLHYEMAIYAPSGRKIAYMSGPRHGLLTVASDLYLMNADGSDPVRLTFFNVPGNAEYVGPSQIQKEAWSPDGSWLVSAYYDEAAKVSHLFKLIFEGKCGRP